MSFWHTPLFGTGPKDPPRPVSPAAIRCARIRQTRGIEPARGVMIGLIVGKVLMVAGVIVGVTFGFAAGVAAKGGPGSVPFLASFAADCAKAFRADWPEALSSLLLVAAFIAAFPIFARWTFDRSVHRISSFTQRRARQIRRSWKSVVIALSAVYLAMALLATITLGWQFALFGAASLAVLFGTALVLTGLVARRGRHLTCARCSYPMGSWRGATERCPECGTEWRRPWRHTIGERRVAWAWVVGGVAAVLLCSTIQVLMVASVFN